MFCETQLKKAHVYPYLHVASLPGVQSTGSRLICGGCNFCETVVMALRLCQWGYRSPHPPQEEGFKRVVMCSGKVYYELAKKRAEEKKEKEVAIIRLEQVS